MYVTQKYILPQLRVNSHIAGLEFDWQKTMLLCRLCGTAQREIASQTS